MPRGYKTTQRPRRQCTPPSGVWVARLDSPPDYTSKYTASDHLPSETTCRYHAYAAHRSRELSVGDDLQVYRIRAPSFGDDFHISREYSVGNDLQGPRALRRRPPGITRKLRVECENIPSETIFKYHECFGDDLQVSRVNRASRPRTLRRRRPLSVPNLSTLLRRRLLNITCKPRFESKNISSETIFKYRKHFGENLQVLRATIANLVWFSIEDHLQVSSFCLWRGPPGITR